MAAATPEQKTPIEKRLEARDPEKARSPLEKRLGTGKEEETPAAELEKMQVQILGIQTGLEVPDNAVTRAIHSFSSGGMREIGSTLDLPFKGTPVTDWLEERGTVTPMQEGVDEWAQRTGRLTGFGLTWGLAEASLAIKAPKVVGAIAPSVKSSKLIPTVRSVVADTVMATARYPVKAVMLETGAGAFSGLVGGAVKAAGGSETAQAAGEILGAFFIGIPTLIRSGEKKIASLFAKRQFRNESVTSLEDMRNAVRANDPAVAQARKIIEDGTTATKMMPSGKTKLEEQTDEANALVRKLKALGVNAEPMPADVLDAGAQTLRRDLMAHSPAYREIVVQKRAENMLELERVFDPNLPDDVGAASAQQLIRAQNEKRLDKVAQDVRTANEQVDALIDGSLGLDKGAASRVGADALVQAQKNHADEVRRMYDALPQDTKIEVANLDALLARLGEKRVRELLPEAQIRSLKNVVQRTEGKTKILDATGKPYERESVPYVEFKDLRDLDKAVNAALGDPNTPRAEIGVLNEIKDEIEVAFDMMEAAFDTNEVSRAYRAARQFAREGYRIYRDEPTPLGRRVTAAGRVLAGRRANVAAESTLKEFWMQGPEGRTAGEDFWNSTARMRVDGNEAGAVAAENAFHDYILADFVDAAAPDPAAPPVAKKARLWMKRYKDELDLFPQARERVEAILNGTQKLEAAEGILKQTQTEIRREALRGFVDMDDPQRAVEVLMKQRNSGKLMGKLLERIAGDSDAVAGLKRSVVDDLRLTGFKEGEGGVPEIQPDKLLGYVRRNRKALTRLFGETQIQHWETFANGGRVLSPSAQRIPPTTRARTDKKGSKIGDVGAALWSLTSRSGVDGASALIHARNFMQNLMKQYPTIRVQQVVEHALVDDDFMQLLMRDLPKTEMARTAFSNQMRFHLGVIALNHARGPLDLPKREKIDDEPGERISMANDRAVQAAREGRL